MELKEYIQIIRNNIKIFMSVIIFAVVIGFVYFHFRPVSYTVSLTLNITRLGSQDTAEFKYDDFYRLQADEKFAETIVEWLKSPRVVENIFKDAGLETDRLSLKTLGKSIKPEKRSSQVIFVRLVASDERTAQKLADSAFKVIRQNTQNLNNDQKETTWFEVVADKPVIRKDQYDPKFVLAGSSLSGIFLGFWTVMIRHYLKQK